ncbi:hypothetical protein FB451DRAFT_1379061 [Mycena latifolia]|nr:hypothetical protein FB451DRAFT_1379061 [Mycena latifolia]
MSNRADTAPPASPAKRVFPARKKVDRIQLRWGAGVPKNTVGSPRRIPPPPRQKAPPRPPKTPLERAVRKAMYALPRRASTADISAVLAQFQTLADNSHPGLFVVYQLPLAGLAADEGRGLSSFRAMPREGRRITVALATVGAAPIVGRMDEADKQFFVFTVHGADDSNTFFFEPAANSVAKGAVPAWMDWLWKENRDEHVWVNTPLAGRSTRGIGARSPELALDFLCQLLVNGFDLDAVAGGEVEGFQPVADRRLLEVCLSRVSLLVSDLQPRRWLSFSLLFKTPPSIKTLGDDEFYVFQCKTSRLTVSLQAQDIARVKTLLTTLKTSVGDCSSLKNQPRPASSPQVQARKRQDPLQDTFKLQDLAQESRSASSLQVQDIKTTSGGSRSRSRPLGDLDSRQDIKTVGGSFARRFKTAGGARARSRPLGDPSLGGSRPRGDPAQDQDRWGILTQDKTEDRWGILSQDKIEVRRGSLPQDQDRWGNLTQDKTEDRWGILSQDKTEDRWGILSQDKTEDRRGSLPQDRPRGEPAQDTGGSRLKTGPRRRPAGDRLYRWSEAPSRGGVPHYFLGKGESFDSILVLPCRGSQA